MLTTSFSDDYWNKIQKIVRSEVDEIASQLNDRRRDNLLLTFAETAKFLRISKPTLHKYVKNGIITSHRIEKRVLFFESDVLSSIKERKVAHNLKKYVKSAA